MSENQTESPVAEIEPPLQMLAIKLPIPEYPYPASITVPMTPEVYQAIMEQPEETRKKMMSTILINMLCEGLSTILVPSGAPKKTESGLILP